MKPFLFILFFVIIQPIFGQLDRTKTNTEKGKKNISIPYNSKPAKKPVSVVIDPSNGFKRAYQKEQEKIKQQKEEEKIKNKGIITPALLRKINLKKNLERNQLIIPIVDKDMGVFHTKSDKVFINSFDYSIIDGDVIDIYKNGVKIVSNYTLRKDLKRFEIPIEIGFNRIEIVAVSEGKFRPNSGAFTIYDSFDQIISSDLWNLAKGAKVIALIIREK